MYTYRLWGRLLYNPESSPDTWRRYLAGEFHQAAPAVERALSNASRILPLVTTAHGPSAANNHYWPEMYTNMPILDPARPHPYTDTLTPKRFGAVSPFDPALFSRVDDFAHQLIVRQRLGMYSPLEVAQWLEDLASRAIAELARAEAQAGSRKSPQFRRLAADVAIQSRIGRFFAWKLRSALLYALYDFTGDRAAVEESLKAYRTARAHWVELATLAASVYRPDITFGYDAHLRGHWRDRLAAIDDDLGDIEKRLSIAKPNGKAAAAIAAALRQPARGVASCRHVPPRNFAAGRPLRIALEFEGSVPPASVRLWYRHVNQAEDYRVERMEGTGKTYAYLIPADYTTSPYPLQYFFEVREGPEAALVYPGLGPDLVDQPYFLVRRA
jgi:hypothetical protein